MKPIFFSITFLLFLVSGFSQIVDSSRREIKLQGAVNFRDIGGYKTKDGMHVKWGKIYRSAALNNLTPQDLEILGKKSLQFDIDFRGPYEVKIAPDKIPVSVNQISLPAGSENIGDSTYMKQMVVSMKSDSALIQFYSNLAPFHDRYKPLFDLLLTVKSDSALLFHCSAGKDRTGIAATLILYALGVDDTTILADYLATNYYRRNENERAIKGMVALYKMNQETAANMMAAKESYIEATFNIIRLKYGSIDLFLEMEMGLTAEKRNKLKQKFLE